MSRLRHKPLAAFLACVSATLVLIAGADAANRAGMDRRLANALVVAQTDVAGLGLVPSSAAVPEMVLHRCLTRTSFAVTAWAGSPSYINPHAAGVGSLATVLKTTSTARRYYRFATKALLRGCLPHYFRYEYAPPRPTVGRMRELSFPRYGAQSAAWRAPVDYKSGSHANFDFIVVRERRAVLVDDFFIFSGWPTQDPNAPNRLTVSGVERQSISRQLARAASVERPAWPKPGQYAGTTSEQDNPYSDRVTFKVVDHGKRVTGFAASDGYNNMCNWLGSPDTVFDYRVKVPLMKVKKTGSFSGTAKATTGPFTGTFRVKGKFSSGTATGTVTRLGTSGTCGSDASNPTTARYLERFTAQRT